MFKFSKAEIILHGFSRERLCQWSPKWSTCIHPLGVQIITFAQDNLYNNVLLILLYQVIKQIIHIKFDFQQSFIKYLANIVFISFKCCNIYSIKFIIKGMFVVDKEFIYWQKGRCNCI